MLFRGKALAGVLIALVALFAVAVPAAMAEGSQTIAAATPVIPGTPESGDTTNGGSGNFNDTCDPPYESNRNSFWLLPVTVGDQVTIDWGAVISDSTCLSVYPIGTTDFSLQNTRVERSSEQGSNGKQQTVFTAPGTGNLVLNFSGLAFTSGCTHCAGPYEFSVTIRHSIQIGLPLYSTFPATGTLTASLSQNNGAIVPNGVPFALGASWQSEGRKESSVTYAGSIGNSVPFALALPATAIGKTVTLQVGMPESAGYVAATSNAIKVKVEAPPAPPAPVAKPKPKPRKRHHRHHRRHRRHHHRRHHR